LLSQLIGCAQHPDGNLAPVGNEDFLELGHGQGPLGREILGQ
jgi:hypothetical protein